jgi:glycosyltransferase involved in cell wall biosynthesis
VANLRAEKGHDTLLSAARRVVRNQPEVEFLFVGDGPLRGALEDQVHASGLARNVRFLGERSDVAALLGAADLFVLPSRSEASPNSVVEAMAAGLPVVATRVGGVPELIESGVNGMLVPPDHPDALTAVLLDLIRRPTFALKLGRAARLQVEHRFSFERMVSAFAALYRAELARRTAHAIPNRELAAS